MTNNEPKGREQARKRPKWIPFALGAAALLAGWAVIFMVHRAQVKVPDMPRVVISDAQVSASMQALAARAKELVVSPQDEKIIAAFHELGTLEAQGVKPGENKQAEVERATEDFKALIRPMLHGERDHYLLLGDKLAVEFDHLLGQLAAESAGSGGLLMRLKAGGADVDKLVEIAGSFPAKAVERGVLGPDGSINGSSLIPQVVFRRRWRALADLPYRAGFTDDEIRASLDFTVVFSSDEAVDKRLRAAAELGGRDKAYDWRLAAALLNYGAGRNAAAAAAIATILADGRKDELLEDFASSLEP